MVVTVDCVVVVVGSVVVATLPGRIILRDKPSGDATLLVHGVL